MDEMNINELINNYINSTLAKKWINPIIDELEYSASEVDENLIEKLKNIINKYHGIKDEYDIKIDNNIRKILGYYYYYLYCENRNEKYYQYSFSYLGPLINEDEDARSTFFDLWTREAKEDEEIRHNLLNFIMNFMEFK